MSSTDTLWLAIAAALTFLACGDPDSPPDYLYRETFEQTCGALPCGWQQIGGEPGQVTYGELLHPGESGLTLDGPDSIVIGPAGGVGRVNLFGGQLDVRIAGSCDGGSSLVVELTIVVPRGDAGASDSDTMRGRATPGSWAGDIFPVIATRAGDPTSPFSGTSLPGDFQITSLSIQKTGAGTCFIGEIVIDDVDATLTRPDNSC